MVVRTVSVVVVLCAALAAAAAPGASGAPVLAPEPEAGSTTTGAAEGSGTGWPGGRWQPYDPMYGTQKVTNIPIEMRDGVTLIADVTYPTDLDTGERAVGPFPVLLTQNPYFCQDYSVLPEPASENPLVGSGDYFVERGYIYAFVCIRGAGRSEGEFEYTDYGTTALDGVELVEWAAQLEGSNGDVGLTGCSFLGLNQMFTAARLPEDHPVKVMSPFCAGAEVYHEGTFAWGFPRQTFHFFAGGGVLFDPRYSPKGAALYTNAMSGGSKAFYSENWQIASPGNYVEQIADTDIPALFYSGYDDIFALGAQTMTAYLQNAYFDRPTYRPMQPGDAVTGRYQVIIGPWDHLSIDIDQDLQLEWYDTFLKGQDTGMDDTSTPFHLWDMTAERWINTATMPFAEEHTPYYLGSSGALSAAPSEAAGADPIVFAQPGTPGATLTYTTEPFEDGATLAGPIGARLYASSTNTDLHLIADLIDVAPDGTETPLTFGDVVGSTRARNPERSWYDDDGLPIMPYCVCDQAVPLVPGEVVPLDFWLSPRIATIEPGHALKLVVTTQTPEAECGTVLGPRPCEPTATQAQNMPGVYSVAHGPTGPSSLNLPLLPYGYFESAGTGPTPRDFGPPATGPIAATVDRLGGDDRVATAIEVSQSAHPDDADTVVVARADEYADALAGAPLAASEGAPILLTSSASLLPAVESEIRRLGARSAILLGGEAALAPAVEDRLRAIGVDVRRVAGPNRFGTAAGIAEELGGEFGTVVLAEGISADPARGWPDALSAAPYGALTRSPILLTARDALPPETAAALEDVGATETIVVGGPSAVGAAVVDALADAGHGPRRLAGSDRFATNAAVYDEGAGRGMDPTTLWVASGSDWPDALAGAAVAGAAGQGLVLVAPDDLDASPSTRDLIAARAAEIDAVRLLGGGSALSARVEEQIRELLGDR